jgi:hypothetical protein
MAGPNTQIPNRRGDSLRAAAINPPPTQKPKLLDQVRQAIRARHYSPRTEETSPFHSQPALFARVCLPAPWQAGGSA